MSDSQDAMLAGLKVLDCGENVSAPYAAKLMADLGADVIKVEPPVTGDLARERGPYPRDHEGDREQSGLFLALNTNKRGVTIDLVNPEGRALLDRLAAHADVLIHNYTPSRAKSLGLDYERLSAVNGRLIVTQITTYGATGPKSDWMAHNLNAVAAGGWLYMSPGYSKNFELPPLKAFGQQGDFQGGANGAVATMGALFARRVRRARTVGGRFDPGGGRRRAGTGVHQVDLPRRSGPSMRHLGTERPLRNPALQGRPAPLPDPGRGALDAPGRDDG